MFFKKCIMLYIVALTLHCCFSAKNTGPKDKSKDKSNCCVGHSCGSSCDKTWTFVFSNEGLPAAGINPDSKLVGQSVSMVKAVCRLAKKKCKSIVFPRKKCWNGATNTSEVLDTSMYDVCANLVKSPTRDLNYDFPPHPIYKIPDPVLIVRKDSTITMADLQQCNDKTFAYPENTALNRECILTGGLYADPTQLFPVDPFPDFNVGMQAIATKVDTGYVDLGIAITRFVDPTILDGTHATLKSLGPVQCTDTLINLNMMVRVDNQEFIEWWTPALKEFICSGDKYDDFCEAMEDEFGVDPLCFNYNPMSNECKNKFKGPTQPRGTPKPFDVTNCVNN